MASAPFPSPAMTPPSFRSMTERDIYPHPSHPSYPSQVNTGASNSQFSHPQPPQHGHDSAPDGSKMFIPPPNVSSSVATKRLSFRPVESNRLQVNRQAGERLQTESEIMSVQNRPVLPIRDFSGREKNEEELKNELVHFH